MKLRLKTCIFLSGLFTLLCTDPIFADALSASSCSREHVQSAIDQAADGDVVQVPAGSCAWSDRVTISNKRVTLMGAGIDKTIIETLVSSGFNAALWIDSNKPVRVSGFTFTGDPGDKGVIRIAGSMTGWRMDHLKFLDIDGKPMDILASSGVINHNEFIGKIRSTHVHGQGDASWSSSWSPGGPQTVFFENNVFDLSDFHTIVSCVEGCRYTFRHNSVVNGSISTHGADTANRSGGVIEAYNNTFTSNSEQGRAIFMRGGTAVIFNNTFNGFRDTLISLANYRTCYNISWVGVGHDNNRNRCDGSQPIDGNLARPGHTGSHSGSSGQSTLVDTQKSFTPNEFVGWHVWNLSDGSKGKITSNNATTVTATLAGGSQNSWNAGDQYKITSGWPCKDQIGRGPGGSLGNQPSQPLYQWNNSWSHDGSTPVSPEIFPNAGYTCDDPGVYDQIRKGQDYFDNVARPDYTPYTYPHPATFDGGVAAPQNLRVD